MEAPVDVACEKDPHSHLILTHMEEEVRISQGPITGVFILLTRTRCLWPIIAMEINTSVRWL